MVEELQVGGTPIKHVKYWKAPRIVEFTLKYTVPTFRKAFDSNNKRDVLQRLKDVIHTMRPAVTGQTQANAEDFYYYYYYYYYCYNFI